MASLKDTDLDKVKEKPAQRRITLNIGLKGLRNVEALKNFREAPSKPKTRDHSQP